MVLLHSATTPNLPPLGPVALGLGPGDRSLLPHQQRRAKRMQTIGCQTDAAELVELRQLQSSLKEVREELTTVNGELGHTERRLRNEVQEEYDERMRTFEKRTRDKLRYLKQRQEQGMSVMRKAMNAQMHNAKIEQEAEIKKANDVQYASDSRELLAMRAQMEQMETRINVLMADNGSLREQIEKRGASAAPSGGGNRRGSLAADEGAEKRVAELEAQLASRDATIKALRDQLAKGGK